MRILLCPRCGTQDDAVEVGPSQFAFQCPACGTVFAVDRGEWYLLPATRLFKLARTLKSFSRIYVDTHAMRVQ